MAAAGPLAYAGTAVLTAAFYAVTAHLAARYVIGETPIWRAGIVGLGLAGVSLGLRPYGPSVVIPSSIAADVALVRLAYRAPWRRTGLLVVGHVAVSVILGFLILNVAGIVGA